jgi:hypothetical protein
MHHRFLSKEYMCTPFAQETIAIFLLFRRKKRQTQQNCKKKKNASTEHKPITKETVVIMSLTKTE